MRLLWVEESFNFSANSGAHAEYAYCSAVSTEYKDYAGSRRTLVPHARDIMVAARTETTLAVLNVLSDKADMVMGWGSSELRPMGTASCPDRSRD